jgi:hypothetical protein
MAFDWTQVEGYREDMTAEEKVELLAGFEQKPADEGKWKAQFDKTASELAAVKKQLKAKMTEDEQREAERAANEAAMKEELETFRKNDAIRSSKVSLMGMGYDETMADEMASALYSGDNKAIFEAMKKHNEALQKAMKEQILRDTPAPSGGKSDEKKSEAVLMAEKIGNDTATANKAADDIIAKHYM